MKLTDQMSAAVDGIWAEYDTHPFVKGIEDGTLDKEKFRYYIKQDYLYLIEYTKVFGIGIAKAKSTELTKFFASYIQLLTDGEMDIHRGYMGKFGVTEAELANTPRALDNLSYTIFRGAVKNSNAGGYASTAAKYTKNLKSKLKTINESINALNN